MRSHHRELWIALATLLVAAVAILAAIAFTGGGHNRGTSVEAICSYVLAIGAVAAFGAAVVGAPFPLAREEEPEPVPPPEPEEVSVSPRPRPGLISLSPAELAAFYDNHTTHQASLLTQPYLNNPIEVSGNVSDVTRRDDYDLVVLTGKSGPGIMLTFRDEAERKAVVQLLKGRSMTARGTLDQVERHWIYLEDCQLL